MAFHGDSDVTGCPGENGSISFSGSIDSDQKSDLFSCIPQLSDDSSLEIEERETTHNGENNKSACPNLKYQSTSSDDNTSEFKKETEEKKKANDCVPVDRGWAWVIMTAVFILILMFAGYGFALSIFFLEFMEMFHTSAATATAMFGLLTASFGIGNIVVAHMMMPRWETRAIVLTGAIINSFTLAISSLAPNIIFLNIAHIVIGFSQSMLYVPSSTLMGQYFSARRSFATAVANSGISVSAFLFPPLVQYLITSFGARGALLIFSGMNMQMIVAACLLRPIQFYQRKNCRPWPPGRSESGSGVPSGHSVHSGRPRTAVEINNFDARGKDSGSTVDDHERSEIAAEESMVEMALLGESHPCQAPRLMNGESPGTYEAKELGRKSPSYTLAPPSGIAEEITNSRSQDTLCLKESLEFLVKSDPCPTSASLITVYGSALHLHRVKDAGDKNQRSVEEDATRRSDNWCMKIVSKVVDLSLMQNWMFRLLIASLPLGLNVGFISIYFPSLGVGNGLSRSMAALLMSVVGGVDLISRLTVGYVADLGIIKRTHMVVIALLVMSVACQFTRLYTTFAMLSLFAVVHGLFGGTCQNVFVVVIIDLMGISELGKTMSIVLLLNSVISSLINPIIGSLADLSGSYVLPFHFLGACLFLSAIILLTEPLAQKLEDKRIRSLQETRNDHV